MTLKWSKRLRESGLHSPVGNVAFDTMKSQSRRFMSKVFCFRIILTGFTLFTFSKDYQYINQVYFIPIELESSFVEAKLVHC